MLLDKILLQLPVASPDTVAAEKIKQATNVVSSRVDSLAHKLNPDSIAAITPQKIVDDFKYLDLGGLVTSLSSQLVSLGLRILAAILIFYVGKFIINKIYSLARALMISKDFDRSLTSFLLSFIKITLLFLLIITVIGVIGIETSSFIAIFASAGVALGMALSGTLQNFAGGVLILLIKPYKVGDYIEFGEHKGFVREIQIFNTVLTTFNNDRIVVPNGGISTGTVNNFSSEPYHRMEWRVSISYGDNVDTARKVIMDIIKNEARIIHDNSEVLPVADENETPEVEEQIEKLSWWRRLLHLEKKRAAEWRDNKALEIAQKLNAVDYTPYVALESMEDSQIVLVARAWTEVKNYWPVLYKINEEIYNLLPKNGLHFPFPQMDVHVKND